MNKKNEYKYYTHLMSNEPYKEVKVIHKNWLQQIFCKHSYRYLIKKRINQHVLNVRGDEVEKICTKCGKTDGSIFMEYEGMGYK